MQTQLLALARERQNAQRAKDTMASIIEAAKNSADYQNALSAKEQAETGIALFESEIKSMALQEYRETGNKRPDLSVNVKVFKVSTFSYEPAKAKAWAISNLTTALKLDAAKFEAAVESGDVPAEIATVETKDDPRVQISASL